MKTLLLMAFIAAPALAGELPLNATYGTPTGCLQYADGGREGVIYNVPISPGDDFGLIVNSRELLEQESVCEPLASKLGIVDFSCSGGDQEFQEQVALSLNPSADILTLTYEDGAIDLRRCPLDTPPATM